MSSITENLRKCVLSIARKVYPHRDGLSCVQTAFSENQYFANASRKVLRLTVRPLQRNAVCRAILQPRGKRRIHLYLGERQKPAESIATFIMAEFS